DAVLHGQLHLRLIPGDTHDLSLFRGRYYLYWSPFPAVLLLPFVALFGVRFSDVMFTLAVAALNVALVALVLRQACRRGLVDLSRLQRGLLILFFAFGTVHITLAPFGRVWFTAQLVGFGCGALAYLATLRLSGGWAFFLTGAAMAGALLTRNHLILLGLWLACYLLYEHRSTPRGRLAAYVLAGVAPVVLAVLLLAVYNLVRFGSALDNGLDYHRMSDFFVEDYRRYGAFSLHYLPANVFYQYLAYPFPVRPNSFMGGSLFLLSPVFFGALIGAVVGRPRWSTWALLATVVAVAIPILLLMGTGWMQWGPRYTLDFTLPLLLLTALGIRRWPIPLLALLVAISIVHYLWGTLIFSTHIPYPL
ncbi:MAG TPA: hypothetical protein VEZ12_09810, partial [Herpetosiphonaceae bacterium]|nr:hypothetical protein [Herpetosiphonaceae bacterium]